MFKRIFSLSLLLTCVLLACTKSKNSESTLSGNVLADGSSTVFPVTEAMAEEFRAIAPEVRVTVGMSGTGGGFKKFVMGETDISNASRPIKDSEAEKARSNGIEYGAYEVAYDGLSILVNPKNTWVDFFTVEELKKIWDRDSKVQLWSDIRPNWPKKPIKLYGPGTDSGTFDYFTEVINGEAGKSRADYTMSEDDNVLVTGISSEEYALGYFGYAYYEANKTSVKAVPVKNSKGEAVTPDTNTINNGSYAPLSRPIYIYVNKNSIATKPQVKEFLRFYLTKAPTIVSEVGYVALPQAKYDEQIKSVQ